MSRYRFSEYSAQWPAAFEREAACLRQLLGAQLVEVHHVGSTSVPGLAAKPIIDLLPLVHELEVVDAINERFEEAGYKVWGEYGIPSRRFFTKDREGERTHNLHFFKVGSPDAGRHLVFAAYLREHDDARVEYETLKRAVYAQHPDNIAAYNDGKDAWIKRVETLAGAWWREREAGPPGATARHSRAPD